MILLDMNQVTISNLMAQLGNHTNAQIEESIFRHMILNSIRSYKAQFGGNYGELIIACDNKNYWRKSIFPYYKASRKKAQEKSEINWPLIFEYIEKIKQELKDYFPYRVIDIETAEADDIIAVLATNVNLYDKVLIISADHDFIQLHSLKNIEQYDPIHKRWIHHDNPAAYLREHVMRGDPGDGIPNVLSPDNCFVVGQRQSRLTKQRLETLLTNDPRNYEEVLQRNYYRNLQLIDLANIPADLQAKIMNQYIEQAGKKRDKLMTYFMQHRLKNLLEYITDF